MNRRSGAAFAVTFLLLAATLAASKITSYRRSEPLVQPLDTISTQLGGLTGTDQPPLEEGVLRELKPTSYLTRTYTGAGFAADLFVAFYAQQRAGESMHSPKHCLPGSGWEIWKYDKVEIPVGNARYLVNNYSISRENNRRLVLYWYQSKQRIFSSEYMGKFLLARDALLQNSTSALIVRIIVPDQPGAIDQARRFASDLIPQIERCFGD
jgi:EpsI family protein